MLRPIVILAILTLLALPASAAPLIVASQGAPDLDSLQSCSVDMQHPTCTLYAYTDPAFPSWTTGVSLSALFAGSVRMTLDGSNSGHFEGVCDFVTPPGALVPGMVAFHGPPGGALTFVCTLGGLEAQVLDAQLPSTGGIVPPVGSATCLLNT
ncbi:MAG: hypothetical protein LC624_05285 [Halobacteriales archaeon]|nr:hypothetical protein [Halobacteriales archaeon]